MEIFIDKATKKHGEKYDYSKVDYINTKTKVTIICKKHGEFEQIPKHHLYGFSGCEGCRNIKQPVYTTDTWIKKALEKHRDNFDYSRTVYMNSSTKVTIICRLHGEFKQYPYSHLNTKICCPKCGTRSKHSKDEWIEKAKEVHGNKYDYSKVNYINSRTKVTIICREHEEFEQIPKHHLQGNGCSKCVKKHNYTTDTWTEKAKEIHGNKYDYSKVNYINSKTKVTIICKEHGEFQQIPYAHLHSKSGCIHNCANNTYTTDTWTEKAKEIHGNKYDYSKVNYIDSKTKVTIICREHGEFKQIPYAHLNSKSGCIHNHNKGKLKQNIPIIINSRIRNRYTTDTYIDVCKQIHGNKYDYSKVVYSNGMDKVVIICGEHGEFKQQARKHLQGNGCSKCVKKHNYTTEEWIEKAKNVHGNKYDYSKVNYINSNTKVTIICREHGEFKLLPNCHIQKKRECVKCSDCRFIFSSGDFSERSKQIHGDTYDYSKSNYVDSKTKITIICSEHGEFEQSIHEHLRGSGCVKCSGRYTYTTEEWIKKALEKHGDKYDYSKSNYINSVTDIIIICKEHGEFKQKPYKHLTSNGCSKCSGRHTYTTEEWIEKAMEVHGNKYDYSKVNYINSNTKITIICKEHGEFKQKPYIHLSSSDCPKCSHNYNYTTEEWIEKALEKHGDKYDYSKSNYINSVTDIIIICKEHGEFKQKPYNHLKYNGCSKCGLCPSCELWKTSGKLCEYCKPQIDNKIYQLKKTKEYAIMKYLKEHLPDYEFIHNRSIGSDCTLNDRENTNGHLYPDIRFDLGICHLIIEIDEFQHRGSAYNCDERRMYDIIAKLGQPCIFIRYNPDNNLSNKMKLLNRIQKYLDLTDYIIGNDLIIRAEHIIKYNKYGLKCDYMFYEKH